MQTVFALRLISGISIVNMMGVQIRTVLTKLFRKIRFSRGRTTKEGTPP